MSQFTVVIALERGSRRTLESDAAAVAMRRRVHVVNTDRIPHALLALRVGVFIVMLMWTLDKFFNTAHAARVFENFYGLGGLGSGLLMALDAAELLLVLAFVAGVQQRFTYGAVLVLHTISTVSSYRQYLDPFNNLLFFAAWPMLAACLALYWLRDLDTMWTFRRL